MELRQLRYFCAIAREENLTRAAEALGLRSPSLSQQLRALEQELGTALFERSPAGMTLTAAGRALLPEAQVALTAVDRGARAVAAAAANPTLSIGIPPGVLSDLPALIASAARQAGAVVEFQDLATAVQLPMLQRGVLDAGVLSLPVEVENLVLTVVADEPLGVLMHSRHSLAALDRIDWTDLEGQDLLWFRRDLAPGYHDEVLAVCHRNGWQPRIRTATARRSIMVAELDYSTACVALRPERDGAQAPELVWRPLTVDAPRLRLGLAYPRDTRHLALAQLATDLARQASRNVRKALPRGRIRDHGVP
ncbi:LysR family transcriptional regulator [Nocardia sp. NBC_01388]|uniref:LysR family transcriptional regulator n=1 Tax=Nocardia sp. NBC_01388 TaxID=2903596 RepID=UPI0032510B13